MSLGFNSAAEAVSFGDLQSMAYECAQNDIPEKEAKAILDENNNEKTKPLKEKDVQSALELGYLQCRTDEAGRKILEAHEKNDDSNFADFYQ